MLARTNNTMIVPGHMGEVAGLIGNSLPPGTSLAVFDASINAIASGLRTTG